MTPTNSQALLLELGERERDVCSSASVSRRLLSVVQISSCLALLLWGSCARTGAEADGATDASFDAAVKADSAIVDGAAADQLRVDQTRPDAVAPDSAPIDYSPLFGDGRDGRLSLSGPYDLTAAFPSYHVLRIAEASVELEETPGAAVEDPGLTPGDEVLLIKMKGSVADCADSGHWEIQRVTDVSDKTVTFASAVRLSYGAGDVAELDDQQVRLYKVAQFTDVHLRAGSALSARDWAGAGGGVIAMRVAGELRIDQEAEIEVRGAGYRGAEAVNRSESDGAQGESYCSGERERVVLPHFGGGGGGRYCRSVPSYSACGQGGGGGGHALLGGWADFSPECLDDGNQCAVFNGGMVYGQPDLSELFFGSGGGSGAPENYRYAGKGGAGGGIILIFARRLVLDGRIDASGAAGEPPTDAPTYRNGSGGGGAGGSVRITALEAAVAGELRAIGGQGGVPTSAVQSAGGAGADGRVAIFYQRINGSSNPDEVATLLAPSVDPDPGYLEYLPLTSD